MARQKLLPVWMTFLTNTMKKIDLIAGARPNFMKIASIIRAIEKDGCLTYRLIHTGQHYDHSMSGSFFQELGIPAPSVNLGAGGGSQAEQTASIMCGYEKVLQAEHADLCLVVGDVTSTMACAITAQKEHVPVAHVEAGIRSDDWSMPEEINRLATDAVTNYFFTTSEFANQNLRHAGVSDNRIFFVGNVMIDTLLFNLDKLLKPTLFDEHDLKPQQYVVLTLHRPANVDSPDNLKAMLNAILDGTCGDKIIWPVHPRTMKVLQTLQINVADRLLCVPPLGYLEFNYLVKYARAVITDSGGITEETTVMGVPCMTLRDNTERPETVELGTNELVGTAPDKLAPYLIRLYSNNWKKGAVPPLWDGMAASRIVDVLKRL